MLKTKATAQRERYRIVFWSVILFLGTLAVWHFITAAELISSIVLPSPRAVALKAIQLPQNTFLWPNVLATLSATLLGFVIGTIGGFVLGILLGAVPFLRKLLSPYIVIFQALPKVALAPAIIAWLGYGLTSRVAISAIICFFPVFVNTLSGLGLVEENALSLLRSLGATRWQILRRLGLPTALPNIFAGLKTGVTFALVGVIVGEFLGASRGIGYLIQLYSFQLQTDNVYVLIILLGMIGWLLYMAIDVLDRKLVFWHEPGRTVESG